MAAAGSAGGAVEGTSWSCLVYRCIVCAEAAGDGTGVRFSLATAAAATAAAAAGSLSAGACCDLRQASRATAWSVEST